MSRKYGEYINVWACNQHFGCGNVQGPQRVLGFSRRARICAVCGSDSIGTQSARPVYEKRGWFYKQVGWQIAPIGRGNTEKIEYKTNVIEHD